MTPHSPALERVRGSWMHTFDAWEGYLSLETIYQLDKPDVVLQREASRVDLSFKVTAEIDKLTTKSLYLSICEITLYCNAQECSKIITVDSL